MSRKCHKFHPNWSDDDHRIGLRKSNDSVRRIFRRSFKGILDRKYTEKDIDDFPLIDIDDVNE